MWEKTEAMREYNGRTPEEIKLIIERKTFQDLTVSDVMLYETLASQTKPENNKYQVRKELR